MANNDNLKRFGAGRFKHVLPESVIHARTALCGEIIGILSATIRTLRERV